MMMYFLFNHFRWVSGYKADLTCAARQSDHSIIWKCRSSFLNDIDDDLGWSDRWVHYLVFNYSWLTTSLYFVVFSIWIYYIILLLFEQMHMSLNPFINSKLGKWSSGRLPYIAISAGLTRKEWEKKKRMASSSNNNGILSDRLDSNPWFFCIPSSWPINI